MNAYTSIFLSLYLFNNIFNIIGHFINPNNCITLLPLIFLFHACLVNKYGETEKAKETRWFISILFNWNLIIIFWNITIFIDLNTGLIFWKYLCPSGFKGHASYWALSKKILIKSIHILSTILVSQTWWLLRAHSVNIILIILKTSFFWKLKSRCIFMKVYFLIFLMGCLQGWRIHYYLSFVFTTFIFIFLKDINSTFLF